MSISGKIKSINNKIEQKKAQYDLDGQTAKISDLSSGNVNKYKFLIDKDVLPERNSIKNSTNSIKNSTMLLNLTKRKQAKQKTTEVVLS